MPKSFKNTLDPFPSRSGMGGAYGGRKTPRWKRWAVSFFAGVLLSFVLFLLWVGPRFWDDSSQSQREFAARMLIDRPIRR